MSQPLFLHRIKRIHFVGVGGVGMCGIAEILHHEGYVITGSDAKLNNNIERLKTLGIQVHIGHDEKHIQDAHVLVTSSAIAENNVEVTAARKKMIPIVPRAEMLAELMRFRCGIAIAGTHGKTTTTSLVTSIFNEAALDPTYVIGGKLNSAHTNAYLGAGQYLIAEADESDASFLHLSPMIAAITNVDADHMSTYHGDLNELKDTFIKFVARLPFYGLAVVCIDDPGIASILPKLTRRVITYGFSEQAEMRAIDFKQTGCKVSFIAVSTTGKTLAIELNLAGRHNVLNALAAILIAKECGIPDDAIQQALKKFKGVGRRFEVYSNLQINHIDFDLVDDYGHHPREISATLDAARHAWPDRRIVHVYQPHRYTRTQELFDDLCYSLSQADSLLLLDVYSAGESIIPGAESRDLARNIRQRGGVEPILVKDENDLHEVLKKVLKPNDVVLAQGAGSIGTLVANLVKLFKTV